MSSTNQYYYKFTNKHRWPSGNKFKVAFKLKQRLVNFFDHRFLKFKERIFEIRDAKLDVKNVFLYIDRLVVIDQTPLDKIDPMDKMYPFGQIDFQQC